MTKFYIFIILNLIYSQADTTSVKFDPQTGKRIIIHKNKIKYDPMTGEVIEQDTILIENRKLSLDIDSSRIKKWYRLFGIGPSLTNNLEKVNNNYFVGEEGGNIGINMGLYKKYKKTSLIGICLSGKTQDRKFNQLIQSEIDYYLYAISYINFLKDFNKGYYLRIDAGYASSSYQQFDYEYIDIYKSGFGWMLGAGNAFEFNKFSILTGIDYSILNLNSDIEYIVNFNFSFIFK